MGQTQAEFFKGVQTFTVNSRKSAEILAALDTQGVTVADLDAGDALLATAKEKVGLQDTATRTLRAQTKTFEAAQKKAFAEYQDLAGACRAQLSAEQVKALGLKEMPATPAKFVTTATALLDAIPQNTDVAAALAKRKRDAARLAAIRTAVDAYNQQSIAMTSAKGALKQATTDQNIAIKSLREWFTQQGRFAKLGLKGQPALLSQILPAPPKKPAAKPVEPAK